MRRKAKRFFAGIMAVIMILGSLSYIGPAIQAEASGRTLTKLTMSKKKLTINVGQKKNLKATKTPKSSSAKVSWKSSKTKVAKVNNKGVVTGVGKGTATITASAKSGGKTYKAKCKVTVKRIPVKSVTLSVSKKTLTVGEKITIKATVKPNNASNKKLTYKSADTKVATVSSGGVITAKAAGTVKITATAKDGSKKNASLTITVNKPEVKVTELKTDSSKITLDVGKTQKLNITVLPANASIKTLKYTSASPNVAVVSADGVVTARAQGSSDITIAATDGSGIKTVVKVSVTDNTDNPRVIVTQDGEVDDKNSLVHMLLYANDIDIQGIVQSSSQFHWIGSEKGPDDASKAPYRWPGTDWMYEYVDAYEEVYSNLSKHDAAYPTPAYIRSVVKVGNIGYKGEMDAETEGSKLIKERLLDDDERTLHLMAWGGQNTIARALKDIKAEYESSSEWETIRKRVSEKAKILAWGKQDQTYDEYIGVEWPEIECVNVSGTTYGYLWASTAGDVDSEAKTTLSGTWMRQNIDYGHGALLDKYVTWGDGTYLEGEGDSDQFGSNDELLDSTAWWGGAWTGLKYQRYDFLSEGDSPTFFLLMDTGLRTLEDYGYGSYAGRYALSTSGSTDGWYTNQKDYDPLQNKTVNADWRWIADLQHDFAARADWCITDSYEKANHRPDIQIKEGLDFNVAAGETLKLHATATDPDGDYTSIKWWQYFEADTYVEPEANTGIAIKGANSDIATIKIPDDAKVGDTIIIVAQATDAGKHSLTYNQQVIITVTEADAIDSVTVSGSSSVEVESETTLTASVLPETVSNKNVTWSSSDPSVATVSTSGLVTGVAKGTAIITAASVVNPEKAGKLEITVKAKTYESANTGKARTIVTTDGEVDDMDSFIRLMLYSNEMDIAGIILTSSNFHYAGDSEKGVKAYRWTGVEWINTVFDNYESVYDNLKVHADGYPEPDYLRSIYKVGNIKMGGDMEEETEGSAFMEEILLDDDERKVYIQTWGGVNTTARALKSIEEKYKNTAQWDEIYQKVCEKAVLYIVYNQDDTYDNYIAKNWSDISIIHDEATFLGFAYGWSSAALNSKLQGEWMYKNIKSGHGQLLEGYITTGDGTILPGEIDSEQRASEQYFMTNGGTRYGFISEGDSPSYFYLIDTGLRSIEDPTYGGWGGRFAVNDNGVYKDSVSDYNPYTESTDAKYPLTRWFDDLQSDFGARADWCVASEYSDANHRPTVTVEEGINLTALPGELVTLHAKGEDPDGDKLSYSWWQYYEADTYAGASDGSLDIKGAKTQIASIEVPQDAKAGDTIHLIVQVKDRDDAENYMTHYQRVIIEVEGLEINSLEIVLPEDTDNVDTETNTIIYGEYTRTTNIWAFTVTADVNNGAENYTSFTWEVDDVSVAGLGNPWSYKATATGRTVKFLPLKAGKVTLTMTANDGSGKKASIDLNLVAQSSETIESVTISGDNTVGVDSSTTLSASVLPDTASNKNVTWSSSDTSVATVAASGQVTGVAKGTATIKATSKADPNKVGTYEITVIKTYASANTGKSRTIVTTDGEVDDMDSFMRLMLYSNDMDIAGIILTSSTFHYAGDPEKGIKAERWTGEEWIDTVLDNYESVYDNLKVHADGYPEPDYLRSISKIGNIKTVGDMEKETDGSAFMENILLDDDDRELYIQTWGGTNTTARALKSIEEKYKDTEQWDEIYKKVCDKTTLYIILSQDSTYKEYIAVNWPNISIIHDTGTFWSFAYQWTNVNSALTSKLQGEWMYENIKSGHGALLEGYITTGDGTILPGEVEREQRASEEYFMNNEGTRYGFISEGDSPSYFYLLDTGLRSMEDPTYGGWGGRFAADANGVYKDSVSDYNPYTESTDGNYPLTRWIDDIQSDFGARADWCAASEYSDANHRPTVTVEEGINLTALPGQPITLHAKGEDPDGDKLSYSWWQYYEADTYAGTADGSLGMKGVKTQIASLEVPQDAKAGDTIHLIVQVKDRGNAENYMTHYQRVIIEVEELKINSLEIVLPEDADNIDTKTNTISYGAYSRASNPWAAKLTVVVNGGVENYTKFTWEIDNASFAGFGKPSAPTATAIGRTATLLPLNAGTITVTITANDGSGETASITLNIVDQEAAVP